MIKRRRRTAAAVADDSNAVPAAAPLEPEQYVRWRNDTGRLVAGVECNGKEVEGWTPLRTLSLPESCTPQCEAAGLTRVGFSRE